MSSAAGFRIILNYELMPPIDTWEEDIQAQTGQQLNKVLISNSKLYIPCSNIYNNFDFVNVILYLFFTKLFFFIFSVQGLDFIKFLLN